MPEMNDASLATACKKSKVTLYTRPGCHLCDEAKVAILAAGCTDEYTLDEVNIESDPRLLHSYRNDIPVILINGVEAFRHRLAPEDFRRQLARAAQSGNDIP
jgi:glutaredoxin